jgi:hypothetical protein
MGNHITSIGDEAFEETALLSDPSHWEKGALTIDGYLIKVSEYIPYAYTISDNVRYIASKAFNECYVLTSVIIPSSVQRIGDFAFRYCSMLTSVAIFDGVTSIGEGAFADCDSLTSIILPNSVTNIGGGAFYECKSLISATIGNGVQRIGEATFRGCSNLKTIRYNGTVEQWQTVEKGEGWYDDILATDILCTNGEVILESK